MCDLCLKEVCVPRCPNYSPPKIIHYCSICGEGIYDGEEYVRNDDGEYRHWECFYGMRDLLEWLGYEIKTMKTIEDEN